MEKIDIQKTINEVIYKVIKRREEKGYSLENMAQELKLSLSAYNKIEKQQTKLTFERLLQIQLVLDIPLSELLGINGSTFYHQKVDATGIGYQAGVQNLYQDNKELAESYINSLKEENAFLKKLVEKI